MSEPMNQPLSGAQVRLRAGDYAADVASVGASLRTLTCAGRDLVVPYGADEVRPLFRGVTLVPWPNRVVDGRYTFDGVAHQLALTEPDRGHALHGLAVWTDYAVLEAHDDRVVLGTTIVPQVGYPFRIAIEVEHRLAAESGLTTRVTATNTGPSRAPYGTSGHPYLVGGAGRVDDWTLELAADTVLEVDGRLAPTGVGSVAGGPFDFARPRPIGDLFVDHAFTGVPTGSARLSAADGHGVQMTWDPAVTPWVQVHTGDRPEPELDRIGLAVEPMTCPPDALNSSTDLVVLAPGERHVAAWSIRAFSPPEAG